VTRPPARRRHRSRDVALVAVPVLAAALAACGSDNAYCVDRNDQIVENRYCDNYVGHPGFFWYYGGHAAGGKFVRGTRLTGGDRVANSNVAENVRRGGFGSKTAASGVGRAVSAHSGGG
jgi:hypothetical protein